MPTLNRARALFTALSPLVLMAGFCAVVWLNLRRWQADHERARNQNSHGERQLPLTRHPPVSVLVAAWNEAQGIDAHVQAFLKLCYPDKQLVLCAGGTDSTYSLARAYSDHDRIVVLEQRPGEGKQNALGRCFGASSGEIIFLTDADCRLDDSTFEATLAPLINDDETVSTGGSHPIDVQKQKPFVVQQWLADVYTRSLWGDYTTGLLGRNAAITRTAIDQIGGFAADVRTGTDYHMARELVAHGHRIRVASRSSVATRYADTLASYRKQQARWLRNVVMHGAAYGEWREVRNSLMPSFIGLGMILLPFTSIVLGPIMLALWAVIYAQAVASRVRYCHFGSLVTGQPFDAYVQIPAFVLVDFGVWAAVLPEYLIARLRNRW